MRLLADENFPGPLIRTLRAHGHDVLSVKEVMRGAPDEQILSYADAEGRVLITFDKDFGELAFRHLRPARSGVVLFRLPGATPQWEDERVLQALEGRSDWIGRFSVVTDDRIRMRLLPGAPSTP